MHNGSTDCCDFAAPKTGSRRQSKKSDFEARFKRNFKRKIIGAKIKKNLLPKHHSHISCCHYNAIYDSELQNAIVLRMQLLQGATLTQPFHCDLHALQNTLELCTTAPQIAAILQLQNRISTPKRKNDDFEARFKMNFKRKIINAKSKNLLPKHHSHVSRCHYNAIYDSQLQNAIVLRMQLPLATLTQPFIPLRSADTALQNTIELCTTADGSQIAAILQLQNRISTPKRKNDDFEARFERNFKRKTINAKSTNLLPKHHSHVSRCHYNTIYDSELRNAIVLRMQLPPGATLTQPFHRDLQTLSYKTQ